MYKVQGIFIEFYENFILLPKNLLLHACSAVGLYITSSIGGKTGFLLSCINIGNIGGIGGIQGIRPGLDRRNSLA